MSPYILLTQRVRMECLSSLQTNSESRLYPSATSHVNPNHLSYFEFLGRLLGKAVYEVLRPQLGPHSSVVYVVWCTTVDFAARWGHMLDEQAFGIVI